MSRSSSILAVGLAASAALSIVIFLLWPEAPATAAFTTARTAAAPVEPHGTRVAGAEIHDSDAAALRVATLELEIDALRREIEALRRLVENVPTSAWTDRHAAREPSHVSAEREARAPEPEDVERQLEEEVLAANIRMLDAEARFAADTPDMPAAGRIRDRLEAGFEEHDLRDAAVESFECGRTSCRAELRFDDPQERALSDAILPMLLGVEGQVEVYPDGQSGRLLVFAERRRSS